MTSTAENDAEDVNDFLKRIQELGTKRDQEDEERNRKLEEEILQGRKERQARRAGLCCPELCLPVTICFGLHPANLQDCRTS
jgi:chromosome condensin MukBEF ATPase and DNA-binding subunit MukB